MGRVALTTNDHAKLKRAVAQQFHDLLNFEKLTPIQIDRVVSNARVRIVHLNRDENPQVVVQAGDLAGGCSPTGNCPIWVFKKKSYTFEAILESQGQAFQILRSSGGEYLDFVVVTHGSAFEKELWFYQYAEGKYKQTSCFTARFQQQEFRTNMKKITVTKCR